MKTARKAGALKSWICIVALTFLLPAGATQLTNRLFLSLDQSDGRSPATFTAQVLAKETMSTGCPGGEGEHIL